MQKTKSGPIVKINEALIKQVSSMNAFEQIRTLNFQMRVDNQTKILKIEGLDRLVNLEELNLSYNLIARIENLERLQNLKDLNLAENNIKVIEGLSCLKKLQKLNLNGNQITELGHDLLSLAQLEQLKLSRNKLANISDLRVLTSLPALKNVSICDNPFCRQFGYTDYLIWLKPGLLIIDNKAITASAIEHVHALFEDKRDQPNEVPKPELQQIKLLQSSVAQFDITARSAEKYLDTSVDAKLAPEDLQFLLTSINQQQRIMQERISEKQAERDQAREEYLTIKTVLKDASKNLSSQQVSDIGVQLSEKAMQVEQINHNIQNLLSQRNDFEFRIQEVEQRLLKQERMLEQASDTEDELENEVFQSNQLLEDLHGQKEEIESLLAQSVRQIELLEQDIQKLAQERDGMKFATQQRTQQTMSSNESYPPNFFKTISKHEDTLKERFKELSGMLILYDSQLKYPQNPFISSLLIQKQQANEHRKQALLHKAEPQQPIQSTQPIQPIQPIQSIHPIQSIQRVLTRLEQASGFSIEGLPAPSSSEQWLHIIQALTEHLENKPKSGIVNQEQFLQINTQLEQIHVALGQRKQPASEITHSASPYEKCLDLASSLLKRFQKREKRFQTFQEQRHKFLDEFELEAKEFNQRWKNFEVEKTQLKVDKDDFKREIDNEMSRINVEKSELKRQQQQVESIIKKANNEYESIVAQSHMSKSNVEMGITLLNEEKRQLNDQLLTLKNKMFQQQKRIQELEESSHRLAEEEDIQKKRIQDQYTHSEMLVAEHERLAREISEMTRDYSGYQSQSEQYRAQCEQWQQQFDQIQKLVGQEEQKHMRLEQDSQMLQQQSNKFEQRCRDAEGYLIQLNQELRVREQELSQYDKILGEAKSEKDSLKQLRQDNLRLSKENSLLKRDQEELIKHMNAQQIQLHQNKANLDQLMKIIHQKEGELVELENLSAQAEKELQRVKEEGGRARKETKKQQLEFAKLKNQCDDMHLDCQAAKQEYSVQSQTLKALHKQIEKKVSELSTVTQQCQQASEQNQSKAYETEQELQQLENECESKHFEFRQLVNQIEQLLVERDTISSEVDRLREMEKAMQAYVEDNEQECNGLQDKYTQLNDRVSKLTKREATLSSQVKSLNQSEQQLSQKVVEQEHYLMELKKEFELTQQRLNTIRAQEDTFYIVESLNGREVNGYGADRIQYLVECQSSLQEMEKVLVGYKNELEFVRNQRDQMAKALQEMAPQDVQPVVTSQQVASAKKESPERHGVEEVLFNLDALNENIDKMYQDSFTNNYELE